MNAPAPFTYTEDKDAPEANPELLRAALAVEPELARYYSRRELKDLLERVLWRAKIAAMVFGRLG